MICADQGRSTGVGFENRIPSDWPKGQPYPGDDALVDDICPHACRRMWATMLLNEITLATRPKRGSGNVGRTDLDIETARRWIGGRDFYFVCALVGIDGRAALSRIEPKVKHLEGMRL